MFSINKTKTLTLKVLVLALVAAASFTSCSENFTDSIEDQQQVSARAPIYVYTVNPNVIRIQDTRGTGAFDDTTGNAYREYYLKKLKKSVFNIYAFRYSTETDYSATLASDTSYVHCLVDDAKNYYQGKPAMFMSSDAYTLQMLTDTVSKEPATLYYSNYQEYAYDFFTYYVDDEKQNASTVQRTSDGISMDVTLDGSQDLIYGYAPRLTQNYINSFYPSLTDEEKTKIANARAYSAYAAHRGVHPTITLQHALTRLCFYAYPADEKAGNITITKVGVYTKYKGKFTVASSKVAYLGFEPDEDSTMLYLHDFYDASRSSQMLKPVAVPAYDPLIKDTWSQQSVRLGESMLLPPSVTFPISVWYDEVIDGRTYHRVSYYTATLPETMTSRIFLPEYGYNIDIAVYGSQQAQTKVNIKPWQFVRDVQMEKADSTQTLN